MGKMQLLTEDDLNPGTWDLEITRDDIDEGFREDGSACPIARAVRRSLGLAEEVEIWIGGHSFDLGPVRGTLDGADTDDFISRYDDERGVVPFSCKLVLDWRDYDVD